MSARREITIESGLALKLGGTLVRPTIAYESWGELNTSRDNAIVVFTGLSASAHAHSSPADPSPGWWEAMIGPGRPLDSNRFCVICINTLGSCFGSTGPASVNPATGRRYGASFPDIAAEDIAAAGAKLLDALGIERAAAVLGPSLGGMVVLAFAAGFPRRARTLVSISGAARSTALSIGLRSAQRQAVRLDPKWRGGEYPPDDPPVEGLKLARRIGTLTYRSAAELDQRFGPGGTETIADYLERQAELFVRRFDANCFLAISEAMDRLDLAASHGDLKNAFRDSGLERALVIGVESDWLFPPYQQAEAAAALKAAGIATEFDLLPSFEGHDSFLVDVERFGATLTRFFSTLKMSSRQSAA
jgi:homoserine O-acetyltransferase/O-succinyltransferase